MIWGLAAWGVEHGAGVSLQLPFSAPHMGEVAHSEVRSMSNVSDSAGTDGEECQFSHLTAASSQAPPLCNRTGLRCHVSRSAVPSGLGKVRKARFLAPCGALPSRRAQAPPQPQLSVAGVWGCPGCAGLSHT